MTTITGFLDPDVDGHTSEATHTVQNATWTTAATVNLPIGSHWGGWKCFAEVRGTLDPSNSDTIQMRISIDGTVVETATVSVDTDIKTAVMLGRRTGMTTTGSRSVTVETWRSTGIGTTTLEDVVLYARAARTA